MERLMDVNPEMYQAIIDAIGDADSAEPPEEVNEGAAAQHLSDQTAQAINSGELDIYDILAGHTKVQPGEQELLQSMYDDISSDTGLHGNDDFEDIIERMYDHIQADYGVTDEGITGAAIGGTLGALAGGPIGAAAGGYIGHKVQQTYSKEKALKAAQAKNNPPSKKVAEGEWQEDDVEMIQSAIIRRILHNINDHSELLMKAGPDGVMNAASDVASFHAPMEEIGSSDISIMVREVYREVGVDYPEDEHSDLHEAFEKALGEDYDTRDAYELDDPKHPDFVKNYEEFKSKNPDAKLADFIAHLRSRKNESVAGDDHVNRDVKMKRMGAKELGIADKFKIMPSQMQAMKKGDSEDDLLHYNKLQAKNPMAEMKRLAGLK
jgi:hypothetical protein